MAKQQQTTTTPIAGGAGTAVARAIEPISEAAPRDQSVTDAVTSVSQPAREHIARLAYSFWQNRGCPEGSPEEDWMRAEAELKSRPAATEV